MSEHDNRKEPCRNVLRKREGRGARLARSEEGAYPEVCNRRATPPVGMDRPSQRAGYFETATTFKEIVRAFMAEVDRPTLLLLLVAATMPVVYVYQGVPQFYIAHLADPQNPMTPLYAQYWRFGAVFVLFFAVPAFLWLLLARRPLADLGLRLGDWRLGLKAVGLALAVVVPVLWFNAAAPDMQAEYPLAKEATQGGMGRFVIYELLYVLYYWGWEFLFRGALQLGLLRKLGLAGSCMTQLLPSVLLHIGKPLGETGGAVVVAPIFGALAVRTRSFLYVFLFHYAIGVVNDVFCAMRQGLL